MMAHGQESEVAHNKRKRSEDDNGNQPGHVDRIPQPPPPQTGNTEPINYLSRASTGKLDLIQGDADTFSEVINLIAEYEGVLNRHESLAANLGAKLTAPRLRKAMEGAFEGPIKANPTTDCPFPSHSPTWLDIVKFAKSSPGDFALTTSPDHARICQFYLKGYQVEIAEDDWRLIMSGAMDRLLPAIPNPFEEDETTELATLEILEKRLNVLIKKADDVAKKARVLNYHMSGRKAAITNRRSSLQSPSGGFQAVNHPQQRTGPNPGYDLKADLLQQFTPGGQQFATPLGQPATTITARPLTNSVPPTPTLLSVNSTPKPCVTPHQLISRPSPVFTPNESTPGPTQTDDPSVLHRPLITARIEKLARGETIHPPCDRCRRLKVPCIKHLTACQGCTKKHARCGWKSVTDDELAWITGQGAMAQPEQLEPDVDDGNRQMRPLEPVVLDEVRLVAQAAPVAQSAPRLEPAPRAQVEMADLLRKDDVPELPSPSLMKLDRNHPGMVPTSQSPVRDHSLLSHMASVATAEAEARAAAANPHMQRP